MCIVLHGVLQLKSLRLICQVPRTRGPATPPVASRPHDGGFHQWGKWGLPIGGVPQNGWFLIF